MFPLILALFWFPDALYGFLAAGFYTWYSVAFGLAWSASVSDFFTVLVCDYSYNLIFKINKHGFHLYGALWTFVCAVAAAVAFLGVYYDVIFS